MWARGYLRRSTKEEMRAVANDIGTLREEHYSLTETLIEILQDGPEHREEFFCCLEMLEECEAKLRKLTEEISSEF